MMNTFLLYIYLVRKRAFQTTVCFKRTMQLNYAMRAGSHMKSVNVLRDDIDLRKYFFQFCDSQVPSIGLGLSHYFPSRFIPSPNKLWVRHERANVCKLLRFKLRPDSILRSECWYPRFRRNSCSGKNR